MGYGMVDNATFAGTVVAAGKTLLVLKDLLIFYGKSLLLNNELLSNLGINMAVAETG
jgi:hypothetical protein